MITALAQRTPALLELTRPDKPIVAALYALLGAYLGMPAQEFWDARALAAAAVVGLITAFGLVINDCCDVAVDSIGKPQRPIPSGRVSLPLARAFAYSLAAAALAISAVLGLLLTLFAVAAVALSGAYSYRLKSTLVLGNAAVALLVSSVLFYGAMTVGNVTRSVWIAAIITFPYMLAQEALFNLEDESEDRLAGLRTTATQLGADGTAAFVRAVFALVILIASTPWLLGMGSVAYFGAFAVCICAPIGGLLFLLRPPASERAVANAVKLSRLSWVTSFLPLVLLK